MFFNIKTAFNLPESAESTKCPFCGGVLLFSGEKFTCFSCYRTGNIVDFLSERDGISHKKANWKALREKPNEGEIRNILTANKIAAEYFESQKGEYFKTRAITAETAKSFMLGYSPYDSDELLAFLKKKGVKEVTAIAAGLFYVDNTLKPFFRNRAMFPIKDENDNIVGFGGRRLNDENKKSPKYLNTGENIVFQKRNLLYGLNIAKSFDTVYVVEGYMDVIALHQAGITNAVAALGTAIGENHCSLLKECGIKKVILTMDGDDAGLNSAMKSIPVLKKYFDISVIRMIGAKDPDEFIKNNGKSAFFELAEENSMSFYVKNSADKISTAVDILLDF